MRPEERDELLAAYALGALSGPEAAAVERLVRDDPSAAEQLAGYHEIVDLIALDVPLRRADPQLRGRVLQAAQRMDRPKRRLPVVPALAAAAAIALIAVTIGWNMHLQGTIQDLEEQTATLQAVVSADAQRIDALDREATGRTEEALAAELATAIDTQQRIVAILTSPDVTEAELQPTDAGHGATGRYLWSREQQAGVLIARNLPTLPLGVVYELWLDDGVDLIAVQTFVPSTSGDTQQLVELPYSYQPLSIAVATAPIGGAEKLAPPVVMTGFMLE